MKTITLPIGATTDTLIRRICEQLPDVDTQIFRRVTRNSQGADVVAALLKERADVAIDWGKQ